MGSGRDKVKHSQFKMDFLSVAGRRNRSVNAKRLLSYITVLSAVQHKQLTAANIFSPVHVPSVEDFPGRGRWSSH